MLHILGSFRIFFGIIFLIVGAIGIPVPLFPGIICLIIGATLLHYQPVLRLYVKLKDKVKNKIKKFR